MQEVIVKGLSSNVSSQEIDILKSISIEEWITTIKKTIEECQNERDLMDHLYKSLRVMAILSANK